MFGRISQRTCTQHLRNFINKSIFTTSHQSKNLKKHIDFSKVPKLNKEDLEVQYVRGSGPGGQSTNKTSNNVVMKHLPTGIVVKCHETRSQHQNEKIAQELLIKKLDLLYNGEDAVENQEKRLMLKKSSERVRRQKKRAALKAEFKEKLESEDDKELA